MVGIITPTALADSGASDLPIQPLTSSQTSETQVFWSLPSFSLTDQDGQNLQQRDLLGQVWVASFIYTSCPDVCPLITQQVAALRDALATSGLLGNPVRLVSFTVDPEHDSPAVLRKYAQKFKASNTQQWAFLTGNPAQVKTLLIDGFHLIVESNIQSVTGGDHPHDSGEIAHSNRAMVIDRCGQVRAIHPVLDPERFQQLVIDLKAVVQAADNCKDVTQA